MKLPFVSRAFHEQAVAELTARATNAEGNYERALRHILDLHAQVELLNARERDREDIARQAAGLFAENEVAPIAKAPATLGPEIEKVIREQASESGAFDIMLAKHLRAYARTLKTQGKTPDEIVGALVAWTTTESQFQERA